ncbi:fibronectin type III domain-containing protein [Micromonospora sp. NPDC049240]|uniref:fibronectin type III domain-containing protein n=1 Tax=Micromonospora sp. NPDC049240 TaxID=3155151 RepID=UPI0033FBDEDC
MSGPPVSGPPVSAAPVSGTPAPPWGMTAPPWSSVAPSQPVAGPDPEPAPDTVDAPEAGPNVAEERRGAVAEHRSTEHRRTEHRSTDRHDRDVDGGAPDRGWPLPVDDGLPDFPEAERPDPAAYPEQGSWPAVPSAFHQPAAYPAAVEPESRGRNRTVPALVVGGAVLALVAVVAGGAVWLNRDAAPPAPSPGAVKPKVTGPPPGDLRLRDDTTTITVTWTDPTDGGVPFVVAGGRAGQKLGVMATVDAGQTRYTVNGLSARLDYCFTVLAVYSTDSYATSGQVCTDREGGGATPN